MSADQDIYHEAKKLHDDLRARFAPLPKTEHAYPVDAHKH